MSHGHARLLDAGPGPLDAATANALAQVLQTGVPLVADPWAELGRELGVPPAAVLDQLRAWEACGVLREISGVMEGSALGWESALVAASVPEERLEEVAAVVARCPTVTHDYERRHAFNLWFTIAMPPEIGVARALDALAVEADMRGGFHALRRTETFKIGVRFDLESLENATQAATGATVVAPARLDETGRRLVRALQTPLPYVAAPFDALGRDFATSGASLLSFAREHLGGALRRYVATFRHRQLGVRGNGMIVWRVEDARLAEVGRALAAAPEVSHCYAREAIPGFPYRLYTMVHARDEDAVRAVAARLSAEVGVDDRAILFSAREFKKTRLRYFTPELDAWWAERSAS